MPSYSSYSAAGLIPEAFKQNCLRFTFYTIFEVLSSLPKDRVFKIIFNDDFKIIFNDDIPPTVTGNPFDQTIADYPSYRKNFLEYNLELFNKILHPKGIKPIKNLKMTPMFSGLKKTFLP